MKDSNKHKGLRKKLVLELLNKGIRDEKVLNAINLEILSGYSPRNLHTIQLF